jgi:hypothetical protein
MLADTRKKKTSSSQQASSISFDNLGSTASILGLLVSLYALRQTPCPKRYY